MTYCRFIFSWYDFGQIEILIIINIFAFLNFKSLRFHTDII
jgi:hypothetical protein